MLNITRDQARKKVTFRKSVNDQWTATFVGPDGYAISCALFGNAHTARPAAREFVLDRASERYGFKAK